MRRTPNRVHTSRIRGLGAPSRRKHFHSTCAQHHGCTTAVLSLFACTLGPTVWSVDDPPVTVHAWRSQLYVIRDT